VHRSDSRTGVLQWVVVLVVGVLVVTLVLGLGLISRLSDGQRVLDSAKPAFASARLTGDRASIEAISQDVDMASPIMNPQGGAAAEVPQLIAFVSQKTGLSQTAVLAALAKNFPHTTALLEAIPLTAVTAELPKLLSFLETTLHVSQAQLIGVLTKSFPALAEAITALPTVTAGWDDIPGIGGLTRFNGTPVQTVPELRTYFQSDLIPMLETQQDNFASLDGTSSVNWIAPLLLIVGAIVIVFALAMIALNLRVPLPRRVAIGTAAVVPVVGVGVVVLVLAISLVPRVANGQKLLDALAPANVPARIRGDRTGINMVATIADMENPIMTPQGGAAAEVPQLVAFVSHKTGLSQAAVLATLKKDFPHTTALLEAIPLTAVTAELPKLLTFLETALHVSPTQLLGALPSSFPAITEAITNLPAVTGGWNSLRGAPAFTRFTGTAITTLPQSVTYFSADVIPVLETRHADYEHLVSTSKINFLGPLVLIVGIVVIIYGLLMLEIALRLEPGEKRRAAGAGADGAAPTPASQPG
jgi:hypothetical protein